MVGKGRFGDRVEDSEGGFVKIGGIEFGRREDVVVVAAIDELWFVACEVGEVDEGREAYLDLNVWKVVG